MFTNEEMQEIYLLEILDFYDNDFKELILSLINKDIFINKLDEEQLTILKKYNHFFKDDTKLLDVESYHKMNILYYLSVLKQYELLNNRNVDNINNLNKIIVLDFRTKEKILIDDLDDYLKSFNVK